MRDDAGDQTMKCWHASLIPVASIFVSALIAPPPCLRSGITFIGPPGMRGGLYSQLYTAIRSCEMIVALPQHRIPHERAAINCHSRTLQALHHILPLGQPVASWLELQQTIAGNVPHPACNVRAKHKCQETKQNPSTKNRKTEKQKRGTRRAQRQRDHLALGLVGRRKTNRALRMFLTEHGSRTIMPKACADASIFCRKGRLRQACRCERMRKAETRITQHENRARALRSRIQFDAKSFFRDKKNSANMARRKESKQHTQEKEAER